MDDYHLVTRAYILCTTISKYSALQAIDAKRVILTAEDVEASLGNYIENSDTSFKDSYREATRSNQDNNFQQSLLACALADTDDDGFFTANDLVEPYSAIMKEKKRIAHFDKHLRRFSSEWWKYFDKAWWRSAATFQI